MDKEPISINPNGVRTVFIHTFKIQADAETPNTVVVQLTDPETEKAYEWEVSKEMFGPENQHRIIPGQQGLAHMLAISPKIGEAREAQEYLLFSFFPISPIEALEH
jgi:hypothetical protein